MEDYININNISKKTNAGEDFYLLFGDFLDTFYKASQEIQIQIISEPPEDMEKQEYVPFLASAVHKLANEYGLKPPPWIFNKRCYLSGKKPHFACNANGNLRLLFM